MKTDLWITRLCAKRQYEATFDVPIRNSLVSGAGYIYFDHEPQNAFLTLFFSLAYADGFSFNSHHIT